MRNDDRPPSKSQKKREMNALQDLGSRLLEFSAEALERIDMPEDLKRAVREAKAMKSHEARRRQMQFIGALIRRALELKDQGQLQDARAFQRLEIWRDGLLAGNADTAKDILAACPDADMKRLERLTTEARREKEKNLPPKAFRALFRALRDLAPEG